MQPITPREWFFPLALALVIAVLGTFPYIAGYRAAPPDEVFMDFVGRDIAGANSYFAFARQAAEGRTGLTNLYTPGAPSRAYYNPEWWLMGALSRWTGLSLVALFHIDRVVTVFAFSLAVYYLAAVFLHGRRERRAALLLIACGSGFGWLVWLLNRVAGTELPLPWDIQGVSPFAYLMNKPHFMRAGVCAALGAAWFIRGVQTDRLGCFCAAGVAAAAHSIVRPYHIPESLLFLGLFVLAQAQRGIPVPRALRQALACALCHLPVIIWYVWLWWSNPLGLEGFHAWQPALFLAQIFWYGLPFAALLLHLAVVVASSGGEGKPEFSVPVLWLAAAFLLVQASPWFPWGVESYFAWILAPPLLFIKHTWPALSAWIERRSRPARLRRFAMAAIALAVLPSSLFAYADFFHDLRHPDPRERYYLPRDLLNAMEWLGEQDALEPVVLAGLEISAFLPRIANLRVVSGQDALSAHYYMRNDWVARFFMSAGDDGFKQWLCREQRVAWVLWGPFEQHGSYMNPGDHPWLQPAYTSGPVTVYRVLL